MIVAAFFHEPRAAEARVLIEDGQMLAPRLLPFEIANVAQKKIKSRPDVREQLAADLRDALALPVERVEVVELAVKHGLTPRTPPTCMWRAPSTPRS